MKIRKRKLKNKTEFPKKNEKSKTKKITIKKKQNQKN